MVGLVRVRRRPAASAPATGRVTIIARRVARTFVVVSVLSVLVTACSSASPADDLSAASTAATASAASADDRAGGSASGSTSASTDAGGEVAATATTAPPAQVDVAGEIVVIDASDPGHEIDRRVFGVNVPAWLGPERLADPAFVAETAESGATLVRMPGGSWSNSYRWAACEQRDDERCFWPWAARPSDFVGYLAATGLAGMWTVSINETAESAAAAVAFFNGNVGDERPIGTDRDGVDWGTVDRWASLRVAGGHPDPAGIRLWEVGNEVYGGRPESGGDECASFGWEDVWTCDGREYVNGIAGRDGYLAIREAMLAIDPGIAVGAVGVSEPSAWSGWGDEVIDESGEALDFYVVHDYGFDGSPTPDEALARPAELWPDVATTVSDRLGDVPFAITEYNLVSFEAGDTEQTMRTVTNAFFIAETLGQMVANDVPIAALWNLANGTTGSGTDYGLLDIDAGGRHPTFEAFRIWTGAGTHRLEAVERDGVRIHPTRDDDGRWAVILVNPGGPTSLTFRFDALDGRRTAELSGVSATSLTDRAFVEAAPVAVAVEPGVPFTVPVPAVSISTLELP